MTASTTFITLGTAGGPMLNPLRAQPAHCVLFDDRPILVDCGEGAFSQLKKAGIEYRDVQDIFLTHHHFDHIGSLFACLGLNMMVQRRTPLTIYGPVGTKQIVDGLLLACDVPNEIGFGVPGQRLPHPRDFVHVRELAPGDVVEIQALRVSCCQNTHYRTEEQFLEPGYVSLSYRFDAPDRSIFFTGDTGICKTVESLARGVDLLVGEMMDIDLTMSRVRATNPQMPEERIAMIGQHLSEHHLNAEQLGNLAAAAGASHVVAVHFAPGFITPETSPTYEARMAAVFPGRVSMSQDLGRY